MLILAGNSVEVLLWQELEVSLGLIAACLPTLSVIKIRMPQAWSKRFGLSSDSSWRRKNKSKPDAQISPQASDTLKRDHFNLNGPPKSILLVPEYIKADISTEIAAVYPLPPPDKELFLHYPSVQMDGTITSVPPPALRRDSPNRQSSEKAAEESQLSSQKASGPYSNSPETQAHRTPQSFQREVSNRAPGFVPRGMVQPNTASQPTRISQQPTRISQLQNDTYPDYMTESDTPSTRSSQGWIRSRVGQSWYME
jgi:hypothetical protein